MSDITIPVKQILYVSNIEHKTIPFLLEETKCVEKIDGSYRYTLVCGLTKNRNNQFVIAPRYVAFKNKALLLTGDESQAKRSFETQCGLSRATSVYYSTEQVAVAAKLVFDVATIKNPDTMQYKRVIDEKSCHLTLYTFKGTPNRETKFAVGNSIMLSPELDKHEKQLLLRSILSRNIFKVT